MRKRLIIAIIAVLAIGGYSSPALAGVATVSPAVNATSQVCAQKGTGYCLNAWGGSGTNNKVAMYTNNFTANNAFIIIPVNACHGGDTLTRACAQSGWGSYYPYFVGGLLVEVEYKGAGNLCVGISMTSGADAALQTCPNTSNGVGGGYGTIMVLFGDNTFGENCPGGGLGAAGILADRYWSNNTGVAELLQTGGAVGNAAFFTEIGPSTSCWKTVFS